MSKKGSVPFSLYKATLLDSEAYLLTCYRYIELNPVRAGMVGHPSDYPWSSYMFNALGERNELISPHKLYTRLGETNDERRKSYRELFKSHIDEHSLREIREATNKSWVLGTDEFREKVEALTARQARPRLRGGDRKSNEYRSSKKINRV